MDSILLKSYQAPRVPVSYQIWLQLVTKLEKDAGMDEIAELVNQDPGLVIKVLSVANSAFIGAGSGNEVSSVESALMRLGSNEIVRIVGMLAFSRYHHRGLCRSIVSLRRSTSAFGRNGHADGPFSPAIHPSPKARPTRWA